MNKQIYVIGYYEHYNIGDEQYKNTFNYIFNKFLSDYDIKYIDCDIIELKEFNESDIIILGGGDILNEYFIDKIINKFKNTKNKIIGVSVGIPYVDIIINTNKLNIIDYIFVRTKQDVKLLKEYFNSDRILYLPDISYYLLKCESILKNERFDEILSEINIVKKSKKIIAITISRHIYKDNINDELISNLTEFIKYLITCKYQLIFLPFNTNSENESENDIIIHNEVINMLKSRYPGLDYKSIINIDFYINPSLILKLYDYIYLTIPMRYHATLFSIYKCIPMLPIFSTRKIKNLLLDIDYPYNCKYELKKDEADIPICIDSSILINKFDSCISNMNIIRSNIELVNKNIEFDNLDVLMEIIKRPDNIKVHNVPNSFSRIYLAYSKALEFAHSKDFVHFTDIIDDKLRDICIQVIMYTLTNGSINSIYNYGMKEKLFDDRNDTSLYGVTNEWLWVINDYTKKRYNINSNPKGLFNINYIDQVDYSRSHRSGWQYVYESISYMHNDNSDLYLDLYIDRTFHWNKVVNKFLKIIPFTKSWVGFIHHTFDTTFSEYNCYKLFEDDDFIASLEYCKGLFALSNYLVLKLKEELLRREINVAVYFIPHPTEFCSKKWNYKSFIYNKDKKIINIGAWLRNIFSFYCLELPDKYTFRMKNKRIPWVKKRITDKMRKVCLKGNNMNNYFPSSNFINKLNEFLLEDESSSTDKNGNISSAVSNTAENNWYRHFQNYLQDRFNSIDIIERVSNDEYDELLTKNIVFINLIDASAVNTVIECIVRCTPIIVNNHPAVIELLGKDYPLYFTESNMYNMNKEIRELLTNTKNIYNAYIYLTKLDKTKFKMDYFIKTLKKILLLIK